ncbi:MAG: ABC transporter substrate-binding protein [Burkholderiaceae bacterium]|nr:ABC transporter substrate-binding protein [Burkholderiaceae bacterium]
MPSFRSLRATAVLIAALVAASGAASTVSAATFRWAGASDISSMDPYARNETLLLTFTANIYEPLVRRTPDLKIEPALAVRWGQVSPTTWFFDLRPNVKFHDGTPFSADDVIFSLKRANGKGSNMLSYFSTLKEIRKVSDLRVEVDTNRVDPLLPVKWAAISIMSKAWAEKHNAVTVADLTKAEEGYANRNANGTGPFKLRERRDGERTVLVRNPEWWDKATHNLDEVVYVPISNPATRVAALRSGDIDMIYDVPPADTPALKRDPNLKVVEGAETRVVFLGFIHERDELLNSSVKGRNPFKDRRVREAVYRSVDVEAIRRSVMRGQSYPTALLVAPVINGYMKDLDKRPPMLDPKEARRLLAEAGYPDGFSTGMDCPNDRYVNDEAICQAVAAMLAKIGIKVDLLAQTRNKFFGKVMRKGDYSPGQADFYLMAWSPAATYDVHNVLDLLLQTPSATTRRGQANIGGYSNPAFDALAEKIDTTPEPEARNALIREATRLYMEDYAYVPLHQQALVWAMRSNVEVIQPADNTFPMRWVKIR